MAGEGEVDGLEQVGLAGAVGAVDDGDLGAELHLGGVEVAEVQRAYPGKLRHITQRPVYTFKRIGITR